MVAKVANLLLTESTLADEQINIGEAYTPPSSYSLLKFLQNVQIKNLFFLEISTPNTPPGIVRISPVAIDYLIDWNRSDLRLSLQRKRFLVVPML